MSRLGGKVAIATGGAGRTGSAAIVGMLALSMGLCGAAGARAQMPSAVPDEDLVALYTAFCLDAFPNAASLDRLAIDKKAVAMTASELKALVRENPGRGWMVRTPQALHGITVELPPYVACAARRMTPSGFSTRQRVYLAAVTKYVAAKNGRLMNLPPQESVENGLDVSVHAHGLVLADGQMPETFAMISSNYRGGAPEPWRADAGSGVGVRLVHSFLKQ